MKLVFALFLALLLTACSSTPSSYDPATGAVSGLDSEDLADVIIQKNHVTAITASKAARPIFSMKGVPGQVMELKNVESITVWAPEADSSKTSFEAPGRRPNKLVQFMAATGALVRDIGSVAVPLKMFSEQNKTARHQSDNNLEQFRINTNAWSGTTNAAIEKEPNVYTVPLGSAHAAPLEPATPTVADNAAVQ